MDRMQEYAMLRRELEFLPDALESIEEKALKRKIASQRKTWLFGIPAGSLAACFALFVLLVNIMPTFAYACGRVPVLRDLAKAVAWSPPLSAAVEHEYVQPIGLRQTANDITATVEYVIVDRKQVNVFYTLDSADYPCLYSDTDITLADGSSEGFSTSWSDFGVEGTALRQLDVNFIDRDVPSELSLTLKVFAYDDAELDVAPAEANYGDEMLAENDQEHPDYLTEFTFRLQFDPYFTAQGKTVAVAQDFALDGQQVTVSEVEVYPTHLRMNLTYGPDNTAWLMGLDFYLENERGEQFRPTTNGISATGSQDNPAIASFWMDSPYFSQGEHLTLYVTGGEWRNKEQARIEVDLENGIAENLPDGVRIERTVRRDGGWLVSTSAPYRWGNTTIYQIWDSSYFDAAGREYQCDSRASGNSPMTLDTISGEEWEAHKAYVAENKNRFFETIPLKGYTEDRVWLVPRWTTVTQQDVPVEIPLY